MIDKWDRDYLALARFWADLKSKDPSTKVGAVIVDARRNILGMGYNGFPRGVLDLPKRLNDRPTKYKLVAHAELNAVLNCTLRPVGATIYITMFSCAECAKAVIQSGISRVVAPQPKEERWMSQYETALLMYEEAGVLVELVGPEPVQEEPEGAGAQASF